jgi:hypothetical protein
VSFEPRLVDEPPREPFVGVDGHLAGAVLELSHWPGNTTPRELRHDLSTGAALRYAALAPQRRAQLACGARVVANNHFDTDGTLALFAVLEPEVALARADALLAAAAAGDFFAWPDDRSFAIDAVVGGATDPERSPLAGELAGLAGTARHQRALELLLARLPELLDGELAPWRALWEAPLAAARLDRDDLARAVRDDLVHLDWTVWTAEARARSSRAGSPACFDPGRHALWGASACDRLLVVGPLAGGTTYRFLLSTRSWFDLASRGPLPRPELARLAAELDALEGTRSTDEVAWRAQDVRNASPELWFGVREHESFAEHNEALRPSALAPARVRRAISDALRATLSGSLGD